MTIDSMTPAPTSQPKSLTVALAGNPNSGKTTLFNALTGLRQKVANYPGVTVEKKTGKSTLPDGSTIDIVDLPGTYSLISRSPDEVVAMQVLRGLRRDTPEPDVVVCVVDASNLQRNLYLVSQLMELGRPLVIALNMSDIAERRGIRLSAHRLSETLGVPVVSIVGHKKQGIDTLKQAILEARIAPLPEFVLPAPMKQAIHELASILGTPNAHATAERLLTHDTASDVEGILTNTDLRTRVETLQANLHRENIDPIQADIEAHYRWIDEVSAKALEPACAVLDEVGSGMGGTGYQPVIASEHGLETHATNTLDYARPSNLTDQLDRVFLHKIWGLLTFAAIMACLFVSIFVVADPLMGATEELVAWVGSLVTDWLPEKGAIRDLWTGGIVAGVGGVLVFIPQIAVLFLFLAILEDSGYLARAAFLMDRVLGKLGLNGKSFIPLLSSFACAIPGIMATRTIENRRDRLATIFVAPFMSCSARLPVYGLLIGAFFATHAAWVRGGIMFACYALGVVAAVLTALLFRQTFLKSVPSSFVLELPSYKVPQITQVIRVMVTNTWAFVRRAGTIIFCLSVILWAMAYYPRLDEARETRLVIQAKFVVDVQRALRQGYGVAASNDLNEISELLAGFETSSAEKWKKAKTMLPEDKVEQIQAKVDKEMAAAQLEQSISGRLGHFIEPVIRPLGYDWKMGVGLIASFAAREVFVSQMGIVYAAGDAEDDPASLEEAMLADRYPDGTFVWTTPVAISLLVWFVLAMQCISTTAIVKRETGSWTWALGQIVYMNALAYGCALIAYQVSVRMIG